MDTYRLVIATIIIIYLIILCSAVYSLLKDRSRRPLILIGLLTAAIVVVAMSMGCSRGCADINNFVMPTVGTIEDILT
jgi:multisubunit Na+/H+ antiporter MnhC subunit